MDGGSITIEIDDIELGTVRVEVKDSSGDGAGAIVDLFSLHESVAKLVDKIRQESGRHDN